MAINSAQLMEHHRQVWIDDDVADNFWSETMLFICVDQAIFCNHYHIVDMYCTILCHWSSSTTGPQINCDPMICLLQSISSPCTCICVHYCMCWHECCVRCDRGHFWINCRLESKVINKCCFLRFSIAFRSIYLDPTYRASDDVSASIRSQMTDLVGKVRHQNTLYE